MENNKSIKTFSYIIIALVAALVVFVLVRKNKSDEVEGDYLISQANVESVDVVLKESFPVQVDVIAKGNLPDGCTEIGDNTQQLVGSTFKINLEARKLKDGDIACTQALVPFEETIALENVVGISAGDYTVEINGISKTFKMDVDNYISNVDPLK
jgi:inhibitor of cysteine peptidase